MTKDEILRKDIKRHLILSGMAFNAERNDEPVFTRSVNIERLVSVIVDYIEKGDLPTVLLSR